METITSIIDYSKVLGELDKERAVAFKRMAAKAKTENIDTISDVSITPQYSLDALISFWMSLRQTDGSIDYTTQFLNHLAKKEGRKVVSIEEEKPIRKGNKKKRCS